MIFSIFSILCAVLPCLVFQIVQVYGKKKTCTKGHFLWTYVFLLYLWMVLDVTGIETLAEIMYFKEEGLAGIIRGGINIVPLDSMGMSFVLNIIMFMPLGFLLALIWWEYRIWTRIAVTGFGFSALIEFAQLFSNRTADIDDLMANTVGALLGYCLWKAVCSRCGKLVKPKGICKKEAVWYIGLAALGIFLFYNPFLIMKYF